MDCSWYTHWNSIKTKWLSLCNQTSTTNNFFVRGESPYPLPHLSFGGLSGLNLNLSQSLYIGFCIWKTLFSWSHLPSMAIIVFNPPFPHRTMSINKRSLMMYYLIPSIQNSIALWHCPVMCLCIHFYLLKELPLMWVDRVTDHISLGVILLLCSISRIVVGILLGQWPI